jgi:hypothetical protein
LGAGRGKLKHGWFPWKARVVRPCDADQRRNGRIARPRRLAGLDKQLLLAKCRVQLISTGDYEEAAVREMLVNSAES